MICEVALTSLNLINVSKSFPTGSGGVRDISFDVEAGECVAILGPSGSGKTTLLRLIAGLEVLDSGTIRIGGIDVTRMPPHRRGIAFVPQKPALYPEMTVDSLVESANANSSSIRISPVMSPSEAIELLRLDALRNRRPHELSGGEKQRVSLARALVRGASVLLLDEPFAPLDPPFRAEFRHDLLLINERCAATILFVTHDPVDAWALGRRVGVLGDGRLQCFGTPEVLAAHPSNRFVAFCLGRFCFVEGKTNGGNFESDDGSVSGTLPTTVTTANRIALGVRSKDVTRNVQTVPAVTFRGWTVSAAIPDGAGWTLTLIRGGARLEAWWPPGSSLPLGETSDWRCPLDRCEWFDGPSGERLK